MIEDLRLRNLSKQVQVVSSRSKESNVVTYAGIDQTTGQSIITKPDGGIGYAAYLGNTKPNTVQTVYDPSSKSINQRSI